MGFTAFTSLPEVQQITCRLVVRRVRRLQPRTCDGTVQEELFADWRHHAFVTNSTLTAVEPTSTTATTRSSSRSSPSSRTACWGHLPSGSHAANSRQVAFSSAGVQPRPRRGHRRQHRHRPVGHRAPARHHRPSQAPVRRPPARAATSRSWDQQSASSLAVVVTLTARSGTTDTSCMTSQSRSSQVTVRALLFTQGGTWHSRPSCTGSCARATHIAQASTGPNDVAGSSLQSLAPQPTHDWIQIMEHRSRGLRITALSVILCSFGGAAAYAASGVYTVSGNQITFFYRTQSGSTDSADYSGTGTRNFSGDAPGSAAQTTYLGKYVKNNTLASDTQIDSFSSTYAAGQVNRAVSTSSANKYHVYAYWNYQPASGEPSGFVRG